MLAGSVGLLPGNPTNALADARPEDPDAACAPCHREIYERYRTTPMANASGPAAAGLTPADFLHEASGIHYKVFQESGKVWLSFAREGGPAARKLNGRQELTYFLGSGKRGRTYLFQQQGYWFEAPINWYAKKQIWDMAPNYLSAHQMPLTLAVDPGCLHCHASGAASSLPDARNHYANAPFFNGGITCVACHGDATAHIASGGKVSLANIDAMEPVRRDSICLNCHLEGQAAVVRLGRQLQTFTPGDNLFDFALFFVRRSESGSGGRATSQWEALLKSACKQASGDRLTCTTCHDPHGSPGPSERVAFYRNRCLQCHNQAGFQQTHHPDNADCTACHMARPPSNDIAHEQVTDHWIKKSVSQEPPTAGHNRRSGSRGGCKGRRPGSRTGLRADGSPWRSGRVRSAPSICCSARRSSQGRKCDHELHAQLGFLEQLNGKTEQAAEEYRLALAADSFDSLAGGNLAFIEAGKHRDADAIRLWGSVFVHDPAQLGAGLNLAVVACGTGERSIALATLERLLVFSPDNEKAQAMRANLRSGRQKCGGE